MPPIRIELMTFCLLGSCPTNWTKEASENGEISYIFKHRLDIAIPFNICQYEKGISTLVFIANELFQRSYKQNIGVSL